MRRCIGGNYKIIIVGFFLVCLFPFSVVFAEDCERMIELYNQGTTAKSLVIKEKLFKKALKIPCKDPRILSQLHNNLADTYEKQGKTKEAIIEYQLAIKTDPDLLYPYLSLGDIYFNIGNFEYAVEYYEAGLNLGDDETAKANLKKAKESIPLYKSKQDLMAGLNPFASRNSGIERGGRAILSVPSVNLYFGFDKAVITPQSKCQLDALLKALNSDELRVYRFRLAGHTCILGSDEYNQKLSERRAETVKKWLAKHKIAEDRLETVGFGKRCPIASNESEGDRKLNRRVEIRTVGVALSERSLNSQGTLFLRKGEKFLTEEKYTDAIEILTKALKEFESRRDIGGQKATLIDLSLAWRAKGDNEKANLYLRKAAEMGQ